MIPAYDEVTQTKYLRLRERADLGPYSARSLYPHRWLGQNLLKHEMLEEEHHDRAHFAVDDH